MGLYTSPHLVDFREKNNVKNVALVRIEQLFPLPIDEIKDIVNIYNVDDVFWAQEEPRNMGAWQFVEERIQSVLEKVTGKIDLHFIGRRAAASPATGVFDRHLANQKNIIRLATEANLEEIKKEKSGVSLVKYKLPIE